MKRKLVFSGRYAGYSLQGLQKDLLAGLIVAVITIPLGMAFAIASGVKPEYGIYTSIIGGILIALLGGSKFQIGGPTGAFVPILFGVVMVYGYENLLVAGFLAGIILLLMGIFKFGSLIKFIPKPVTIGFTSGIAVIIFVSQIANFLGLKDVEQHETFFSNLREIIIHIPTINLYSVLTAIICLITILLTPKFVPKIPGPIIGLLLSTVAASLIFPNQVATIGSTFGEIPNTLPNFRIPEITFERIQQMVVPAFIIAVLGSIESLLSAVVADGMTTSKHNSNRELMGQGIANIITPLFGGIPATGAIARTATNIKNGAVSPFSGIFSGLIVLLILMLFAFFSSNIPLASMAPILMVVAWNMSERQVFYQLLKTRSSDSLVLVVTFFLTVFVNLTVAVEVGLLLAGLLLIKRMSDSVVTVKGLPNPKHKYEKIDATMVSSIHDCPQISIYTIEGPLFFGAAQTFEQTILNAIHFKPRVLLLRMGKVPFMDTTGEAYLTSIVKNFSKNGIVLISGINPQPKKLMTNTGLATLIGKDQFFEHTGDAINSALQYLNKDTCLGCKHFAFRECTALSKGTHVIEEK